MDGAPGLTRRRLLGGALSVVLGAPLLAGCGGVRGRRAEELDPRVPALLADTTSVDLHTHAAGAGYARAPRFDLAEHMRRGRLSAVCLCHSADGPVIRRAANGGRIRQYRDPVPGELYAFTGRRLAFMDALVSEHGVQVRRFPEEIIEAGAKASMEIIEGIRSGGDPLTKKVAESFVSALNLLRTRTEGTDMPFLAAREKYIKYS